LRRFCTKIEVFTIFAIGAVLLLLAIGALTKVAGTPNPGLVADDAGDDDSAEEIDDVHP
jgi:hypothetical protein